mmetsp:Transcript_10160/g.13868  ORF Transcript_10160/g.13868 Transcript_10160/m.13868 type:complete len:107 (+) Transcript_10160:300-620(+)
MSAETPLTDGTLHSGEIFDGCWGGREEVDNLMVEERGPNPTWLPRTLREQSCKAGSDEGTPTERRMEFDNGFAGALEFRIEDSIFGVGEAFASEAVLCEAYVGAKP